MSRSRPPRSGTSSETCASTFRISSVAAIANTPSAKVSSRFVFIRPASGGLRSGEGEQIVGLGGQRRRLQRAEPLARSSKALGPLVLSAECQEAPTRTHERESMFQDRGERLPPIGGVLISRRCSLVVALDLG